MIHNRLLTLATIGMELVISVKALAQQKDYRVLPITRHEVAALISQTPLIFDKHSILINRAYNSKVSKAAYEAYTELWIKREYDPKLNLLRGLAAVEYWKAATGLTNEGKNWAVAPSVFKAAESCLKRAYSLEPSSFTAQREYGFFLWQYGNQLSHGLELMKSAIELAPTDAVSHATLGDVYLNLTAAATFNLKEAEKELRLAIKFDPNYIFPRSGLVDLLTRTRRFAEAKTELDICLKLGPPEMASEGWAINARKQIEKGYKQAKR